MTFEKYEPRCTQTRFKDPVASLSKASILSFNKAAQDKFDLRSYPYVILYYDSTLNYIGIELTKIETDYTSKIYFPMSKAVVINLLGFGSTFNVKFSKTKRFSAIKGEDGIDLYIDLTKEI